MNKKRNRGTQFSKDIEDLIWKFLNKYHLIENGKSIAATQRLLAKKYEELGYEGEAPSAKTLVRRTKTLGPYEYDRRRFGESYAKS
ncbi:hypothetical protein L2734_19835 [Parashewanella spongiae]|uniref:hypothetical protein n=1 Tax=Parashewanella spongiae TaxID=342950 RepID=UPI0015D1AB93|nr:hypothetical protein [Parashewanella spongiae]MCL1080356.1 hypothetical protein [Parashewanella spongiae]